jgi:Pentapeptide repeats (8 copies)
MTFWLNSRLYRVTARSLEVTEQGQITERYSKAVDHLGSEKLNVRLGGIYALERIAVDSERDHSTVVEVLSAFVREHSDPMYRYLSELSDVDRHDFHVKAVDSRYPAELQQAIDYFERQPPPLDVTAAITVLGRLPYRSGVRRGDFSGARLRDVNLEGSNFTRANFSGAVLEGVDFSGAILRNANFLGANLNKADLYFAKLEGASLYNVVGVTEDQLGEADIDGWTQQPKGIHIDPSKPRYRQIRPDW